MVNKNFKRLLIRQLTEDKNPIPINMIGKRIKDIRNALGMTQTQLAERINIKQPEIVRIENNPETCSLKTISKITRALNCEFMGMIIPGLPLEEILKAQAEKKARKILDHTYSNMAMEKQAPDKKLYNERLENLILEFTNNPTSALWER